MPVQSHSKQKNYRSVMSIEHALISLVQVQPYNTITVQNIIDKSGYSRRTFYTHFLDKDDLLHQIIQNEANVFIEKIIRNDTVSAPTLTAYDTVHTPIRQGILDYFRYIYNNQLLYQEIASDQLPGISISSLADLIYKEVVAHCHIVFDDKNRELNCDLFCHHCVHTYMAFIQYWIQNKFVWPPEYLAKQSTMLVHSNISIKLRID